MSKMLKITFLVHAIVSVVLGAPLLAMPGRFLGWLGWAPIDPIISRILGAALLALAWGDFRCWRGLAGDEVAFFVEMHLGFTALGALGVLRHLVAARYPAVVWILFAVLVLFAIAWLVALLRKQQ